MFDPSIHVSWPAGLLWLTGVAVAAFLVSWSMSDLRPTRRFPYVGGLAITTAGLTTGYLVWSEGGLSFWTNQWGYGIAGAGAAGVLLTLILTRTRRPGADPQPITPATVAWDALVYGAAEGLLLSVLPVVVTWQMLASNGWGDGWRSVAAGGLSLAAGFVVIAVHHAGYSDFRSSRRKMAQALVGCGVLSLAYLITASPIAPILAHAVLHVAIVRNGMELPPHQEAATSPPESRHLRAA